VGKFQSLSQMQRSISETAFSLRSDTMGITPRLSKFFRYSMKLGLRSRSLGQRLLFHSVNKLHGTAEGRNFVSKGEMIRDEGQSLFVPFALRAQQSHPALPAGLQSPGPRQHRPAPKASDYPAVFRFLSQWF